MPEDTTPSRALHDVGLAAWFGGSLLHALAPNDDARSRAQVLELGAMGVYAIGSIGVTLANRRRLGAQRGVASLATAKAAVSLVAMGATAYSAYLARQAASRPAPAVAPGDAASEAVGTDGAGPAAGARQRLAGLRWAVPALTGALVVMNARMGEQQRPLQVLRGVAGRAWSMLPAPERLAELVPEKLPERVAELVPEGLPERVAELVPDRLGDALPDSLADAIPDAIADLVPERVAARL